ncbi:hypothetical protein CEXT_772091 [Caerostris extrusa]|uniref:Uncharacterized protein n=1 Tax=Caerostris extrusa TaxID=172846 RepID=A0AAV4XID1_CAEEX|nr:hypothetical protein CEXT_772091 [Caerostris extrusa]
MGTEKASAHHPPRCHLFRSYGYLLETVNYVPFDAWKNKRRIRKWNAKPEAPFRSFQTHSMNSPLMGPKRENLEDETSQRASSPEIVERNARWVPTPIEYSNASHPFPKVHPPSIFFIRR